MGPTQCRETELLVRIETDFQEQRGYLEQYHVKCLEESAQILQSLEEQLATLNPEPEEEKIEWVNGDRNLKRSPRADFEPLEALRAVQRRADQVMCPMEDALHRLREALRRAVEARTPTVLEEYQDAVWAIKLERDTQIARREETLKTLQDSREEIPTCTLKSAEIFQTSIEQSNESISSKKEKIVETEASNFHNLEETSRYGREELLRSQTRAAKIEQAVLEASERSYLAKIKEHLLEDSMEQAYQAYLNFKEVPENSQSPSFFIYCSRLFHSGTCHPKLSKKIITNTLEISVQDVQMFRSVGYFMLEIGATKEAIQIFRRVQERAPAEPQSFMDLGLALFFDVRKKFNKDEPEKSRAQLVESIQQIANVLTGEWVDRFSEVEWPALIWINWAVGYGAHIGLGDLWPEKQIERSFFVPGLKLDLVVAMGWDTDWTDIDLHVHEPDGGHGCFWSRDTISGGHVSRDFRCGYGPECYVIKSATEGIYNIDAHYWGSNQVSESTGTTSCVLWSVKNLGTFDFEDFSFRMVRLDRTSSEVRVLRVDMLDKRMFVLNANDDCLKDAQITIE